MTTKSYAEIAAECERAFQNGGPKVYIYRESGGPRPSQLSGKRTLQYAFKGEVVYARRKVHGKREYKWIRLGMGK